MALSQSPAELEREPPSPPPISPIEKALSLHLHIQIWEGIVRDTTQALAIGDEKAKQAKFHEIALMLNRNDRTIWATYSIACKKRKEKLQINDSEFFIPASILKDRRFSVLEIIIGYLKENFSLRFSEIAILLNRDQRNIWTTYSHYKKKK